jgi:drug/metabolite transporter (DMT)-like permease
VQLALNDIAPSQSTLGTLNGVALSVAAALRSIAPAMFTSIFAIGVKEKILWGYLAWFVLVLMGLILTFTMRGLPEQAEGKINVQPAEETD